MHRNTPDMNDVTEAQIEALISEQYPQFDGSVVYSVGAGSVAADTLCRTDGKLMFYLPAGYIYAYIIHGEPDEDEAVLIIKLPESGHGN